LLYIGIAPLLQVAHSFTPVVVVTPVAKKRQLYERFQSVIRPASLNNGLPGKDVSMNKAELIDYIATQADLSKASAGRVLDAAIDGIVATLKTGGTVTLAGFGSFQIGMRKARAGRNPRTGAAIQIAASKVLRFRASKLLKGEVC
jgi:DNA-binding protein HU-beta